MNTIGSLFNSITPGASGNFKNKNFVVTALFLSQVQMSEIRLTKSPSFNREGEEGGKYFTNKLLEATRYCFSCFWAIELLISPKHLRRSNACDKIEAAIQSGADVNCRDMTFGHTPLLIAAKQVRFQSVSLSCILVPYFLFLPSVFVLPLGLCGGSKTSSQLTRWSKYNGPWYLGTYPFCSNVWSFPYFFPLLIPPCPPIFSVFASFLLFSNIHTRPPASSFLIQLFHTTHFLSSILSYSIRNGSVEIMQLLLESNANINAIISEKKVPILLSALFPLLSCSSFSLFLSFFPIVLAFYWEIAVKRKV